MLNAALKQSLRILVPPQNGHGLSFTSLMFLSSPMFAGEAVIESIDNRRRSASLRFVHQFSLTPDPLKTQIFCSAKLSAIKAKPSSERLEIVPSRNCSS
jgi:hypothetical protein